MVVVLTSLGGGALWVGSRKIVPSFHDVLGKRDGQRGREARVFRQVVAARFFLEVGLD